MKEVYGIKTVDQRGEKKNFWTRIGVAHENKDGSLNVYLDFFPVFRTDGQITIQIRDKKESEHDYGN